MTHRTPPDDSPHSHAADRSPAPEVQAARGQRYDAGAEATLLGLWDVLWRQRVLVASITAICAIGSVVVALVITPIYRSEAVLVPVAAEDAPSITGGLGALTSLAGIQLAPSTESKTAVARLRSRAFAASFIGDHDLMKQFFPDQWDEEAKSWIAEDIEDQPSMFDAVKYFREDVFLVQEDPISGLVTAAIEWKDPLEAAEWVNELVVRINREMRERALQEAERNLAYLRSELEKTALVELQQAIFRLIENEMKTVMLAKGREEYAFKVVDAGIVPTERVRPRRTLIVVTATVLGGFAAILIAILHDNIRRQLRARSDDRTS